MKMKKQDKKIEAKNSLENYAYNIRNTIRDEKVKEVLEFIETNEDLEKEEYEEKEKELKDLANPIISKLYQQGSVPDMGNFNAAQNEGADDVNMGPKIEEVD